MCKLPYKAFIRYLCNACGEYNIQGWIQGSNVKCGDCRVEHTTDWEYTSVSSGVSAGIDVFVTGLVDE